MTKLAFFLKPSTKSHQPGLMEATKTAPTEHVPEQFSFNPTVNGHRYWIKGTAHLLESGVCVAHPSTIFDKNLGLCVDIKKGTKLCEEMERTIEKHLASDTYRKYLILDYSIHF